MNQLFVYSGMYEGLESSLCLSLRFISPTEIQVPLRRWPFGFVRGMSWNRRRLRSVPSVAAKSPPATAPSAPHLQRLHSSLPAMATTEMTPLSPPNDTTEPPSESHCRPSTMSLLPVSLSRRKTLSYAIQCAAGVLLGVPIVWLFLQLPRGSDPTRPPSLDTGVIVGGGSCSKDGTRNGSTLCPTFHRSHFPDGFVFGSATAAFQVEGGAKEGGREPCIWDTFSRKPGKIVDHPHGTTGDVASDQYHRYAEDIDLMSQLNVDAYRFSIAWPRIMKLGGSKPEVNPEGLAYYNNLINGLLKKGIQPYVTLYHWDLPQSLYDKYGGWIDRRVVDDFSQYAEACFAAFGDRVKHWITFNEPKTFLVLGYGLGINAPGRCTDRNSCPEGNAATEPYIGAHNVLLAHATVVDIYRKKFMATQGGRVGITVDAEWAEPMTSSATDKEAAEKHLLFQLGWFLDPIYRGDYPAVMRKNVGNRLPVFTPQELALLKGSLDFIGLNHYTSRWISSGHLPENSLLSDNWQDQGLQAFVEQNGTQIGDQAASEWLYIVPWGLGKTLVWMSQRYENPQLFVTENGMDDLDSATKPVADFLNDVRRVSFYEDYLSSVLDAIRNGSDVRGYFAWSLLDNFEWAMGYTRRFGLVYVNYNNQQRQLKESAKWFSRFLARAVL